MKTKYVIFAMLVTMVTVLAGADSAYAQRRAWGERPFSARNREMGMGGNLDNPVVVPPGENFPGMLNENRPFRRNPEGGLWGRQTRRQREMEEAAMQQWLENTENLGNHDLTQVEGEIPSGRTVLRRNSQNPAVAPAFIPRSEGLLADPNAALRNRRPAVSENISPNDKKPLRDMTTEEITSLFDE